MGVDCASGDTLRLASTSTARWKACSCAEPVIKMAINPLSREGADKLGKALHRFRQEDPDLPRRDRRRNGRNGDRRHGRVAPGYLRRAHPPRVQVEVEVGAPKVSYREAPDQDGRVQLQAQEADRRFGPVRPHRRQARMPARRLPRRSSSSKRTSSAAAFPRNTFPRSKRASAIRCTRAPWPSFRSWASRRSWKTARITTSTARTWRSRSALATASARRS